MNNFIELTKIGPFDEITLKGKVQRYSNSEEVASIKYTNGLKVTILHINNYFLITYEINSKLTTAIANTIAKAVEEVLRKYNEI